MILKNIFGKTIEAAKKSARQMYGNDFLVIESSEGAGTDQKANITIFSDNKDKGSSNSQKSSQPFQLPQREAFENGVEFEHSGNLPASDQNRGANCTTKKDTLSSLRKFAESQSKGELNGHKNRIKEPIASAEKNTDNISGVVYNRSFIRKVNPDNNQVIKEYSEDKPPDLDKKPERSLPGEKEASNNFITHFKPSKPKTNNGYMAQQVTSTRHNEREIKALHKRFDKLEALLDSTLISANLDYASHSAFQQLVQTGISTSVIAGWFSEIIKEGVNPYDQSELFMSKLAAIIRNALGEVSNEEAHKFMLFAGPSGSGKTQMIMKLTQHPDFMLDKRIAVIAICPHHEEETPYYTILEPFCTKHEIPFFRINRGLEVTKIVEELKEFDHVFIDTPSLSTEQENSFREFWKIKQLLSPLSPLEIHYVVNAALNRYYFQNSSAKHHPLQPDYVAITHLDEISQWGPLIPFLQKMGCSARYLSTGNKLNNLNEFNPQWFAQKVLQEK